MMSMTRSDAEVVDAIADAFSASLLIPNEGISIAASNGTVWLEGTVEWEFERMAAIDRALDVPGVGAVYNRIDVERPLRRASANIAAPDRRLTVMAMSGAAQGPAQQPASEASTIAAMPC